MTARTCETLRQVDGLPCLLRAEWIVSVGERKADAQFSCSRHLAATARVLISAEGRNPVIHIRSAL